MTTKPKHVHKFKRHKFKTGGFTFFCALPDCSKKLAPALALGKESICWRCGNPFIMTDYALRLVKPHCEDCHKPKHATQQSVQYQNTDNLVIPIQHPELQHPVDTGKVPSLAERLSKAINGEKLDMNDEEEEI